MTSLSTATVVGAARDRAATARPPGRKRRLRRYVGVLFVLPATAYLVTFQLFPMLYGLYLSFTGYSPLDRDGPRLIGADNYTALLGDADFRHSLLVTGQFILAVLPPAVVLALGLALLANRPIRGIGALRAGLYIPHVVPLAAVSLVWLWLYSRNGWFDSLLADVGIAPKDWLLDEGSALPSVAVMRIWKALGGNMVLLLAGLQTIPRDLYEAVAVDGGGWLAKFRYVTLPGLRPVLVYVITLNFVYLSQSFAEIFILTGGGPLRSTTTTNLLIYQEAFENNQFGSASAMAFVLFAFVFGFSFVALRTMRGLR